MVARSPSFRSLTDRAIAAPLTSQAAQRLRVASSKGCLARPGIRDPMLSHAASPPAPQSTMSEGTASAGLSTTLAPWNPGVWRPAITSAGGAFFHNRLQRQHRVLLELAC